MKNQNRTHRIDILAVDDQPANLVALEAVLGDSYNVVTAHSGPEAISVLKEPHRIAVILMDLQMPSMDGFEASAAIKQIPGCEDIPIILITAIYKEEPFILKGYQAGAVDYFSKPFDPEILRMKVAIYASFRQKTEVLKERERQLHETEELLQTGRKLKTVLERLPVGVLIADTEGRICQVNQTVSKICRSDQSVDHDAYGQALGWWDTKGKMIKEPTGPLLRAINHGATSHNHSMQIECFDGTMTTILCSASPLLGKEGSIVGAVVVIQDITETKKIEEVLERKITQFVSLGVELLDQNLIADQRGGNSRSIN